MHTGCHKVKRLGFNICHHGFCILKTFSCCTSHFFACQVEAVVLEMQDPKTGVKSQTQRLVITTIPHAITGEIIKNGCRLHQLVLLLKKESLQKVRRKMWDGASIVKDSGLTYSFVLISAVGSLLGSASHLCGTCI